jgi:hypothetical protein
MVSAMNSASFSASQPAYNPSISPRSASVQSVLPLRALLLATTAPAAARMFLVER